MLVAEVGLNHLGNEDIAMKYVNRIVNSTIDAITFQVLDDSFFHQKKYRGYQLTNEFLLETLLQTKRGKKQYGIAIDSTLVIPIFTGHDLDFFKVLSKDLNNYSLIDSLLSQSDKPIYLSTGMSNIDEIDNCLTRYKSEINQVRLIQTQLSNDITEVNLKAIPYLKDRFKIPVAFGFHCSNINVLYSAVALEPESIFFYIKRGNGETYFDDMHAIPLEQLSEVTNNLRELPLAIGDGIKVPMEDWA